MTLATKIIFIAALILSIIIPFGYYLIGEKNKKRYKRTIGVNAFFFFGAFALASIMMLGGPDVQAAEAAASGSGLATGLIHRSRTCNRTLLYRRRYRSCKRSKRSARRTERGLHHSW